MPKSTLVRKLVLCLASVFISTVIHAAESIVVTSLPALPADLQSRIVISNPSIESNIQVRYQSGSNIRSSTQSFKWTSDNPAGGLGLYVAENAFAANQDFVLRILSTSGATSSSGVTGTVAEYTFTLTASEFASNKLLYFQFPELNLVKDSTYLLQLAATSIVSTNILRVATNNAFSAGTAAQLSDNALPTVVGGSSNDWAFYLVAIPEPRAALPLGITGALAGFVFMINKRRPDHKNRNTDT